MELEEISEQLVDFVQNQTVVNEEWKKQLSVLTEKTISFDARWVSAGKDFVVVVFPITEKPGVEKLRQIGKLTFRFTAEGNECLLAYDDGWDPIALLAKKEFMAITKKQRMKNLFN